LGSFFDVQWSVVVWYNDYMPYSHIPAVGGTLRQEQALVLVVASETRTTEPFSSGDGILRHLTSGTGPSVRTSIEQYAVAWDTLTTKDALAETVSMSWGQSGRITAVSVSLTNVTDTEFTCQ